VLRLVRAMLQASGGCRRHRRQKKVPRDCQFISRGDTASSADPDVAGDGGNDEDVSLPRNFRASFDGDQAGERNAIRSAADAVSGGDYLP